MDVLIVSIKRDYANVGYTLEQCLQEVGVNAQTIVTSSFRPNTAKVVKPKDFKEYAKKAKIIQFMHSVYSDLNIKKNQRIFVFHGGNRYRKNHKRLNKIFNPIVEKSIIQTGDLFNLGAKNEVWLLPAVDTKRIFPVYEKQSDKIIIGHFPSKESTKSSQEINKTIERLKMKFGDKFIYIYSPVRVSWENQMKRVSQCDIYIEACTPKFKHLKYGEWGVAGIEAAALGKIVITHFLSCKRYEKEYGKCELRVANSLNEIEKQLIKLLSLSDDNLLQIKKDTRKWVEKFHSHYAVGKRLKEVIYKI